MRQTPANHKSPLDLVKPPAPLTDAELAALFLLLRRDYSRTVAATATLPIKERASLIHARIEAYSEAFSEALGAALDDATARTLGEWARGGR